VCEFARAKPEAHTEKAGPTAEEGLFMLMPAEYFDIAFWEREIKDAIETSEPSLSNRKITLVHYRLSQVLQAVTGTDAGANFHTWAVWGSRKAGVTIRQED